MDAKEDEIQTGGDTLTLTLTSSLRKVDSSSKKKKKKVQWVDVMGIKDLAEIREFEPWYALSSNWINYFCLRFSYLFKD